MKLKPVTEPGAWRRLGGSQLRWLLALLLLAAIGVGLYYFLDIKSLKFGPRSSPPASPAKPTSPPVKGRPGLPPLPKPQAKGSAVELGPLSPKQGLQRKEQKKRLAAFGLKKSLDAVVRSDESLRLGKLKIKVRDLERKLTMQARGQVHESRLEPGKQEVTLWGVHLVRAGENLWNIHYRLLREYLASRGVVLPPDADEPEPTGRSSPVGRVLKFAEHLVGIYNLRTGQMSYRLDRLEPGQKLVVFNLSEIFGQLAEMDPKDLSGVTYDGRVLLLPAPKRKD